MVDTVDRMVLKSKTYNIFRYIDSNKEKFIKNLRDAVSIPSVSGQPERRDDVITMVHWMEDRLKKLGVEVELCDIGLQVKHL